MDWNRRADKGHPHSLLSPQRREFTRAHSLAACFARWSQGHRKALLNVRIDDTRHVVVLIVNGVIILDRVETSRADARRTTVLALRHLPALSLFTDDLAGFPGSLLADCLLLQILQSADASTALRPVARGFVQKLAAASRLWFRHADH